MKKISPLFRVEFDDTHDTQQQSLFVSSLGKIVVQTSLNGRLIVDASMIVGVVLGGGYVYMWHTADFNLELLQMPVKPTLPPGIHVTRCVALFIKLQCFKEIQPCFSCQLIWDQEHLEGEPESGEGLVAQSFQSHNMRLTIGTEDEERLLTRASLNDGLPVRLYTQQAINSEVVTYLQNGLAISLPSLLKGEIGQVQFTVAWTSVEKNDPLATWFAVDAPLKHILTQ